MTVSARLDALIREKGITRYGVFGSTVEGKELPDGSESASGFVIDQDGRVWSYWIDWSDEEERPVFTDWEEINISGWDESHTGDPEYQDALRTAGLDHLR